MLQRIVDAAPAKDLYDIAVAIRDTLRDDQFIYDPDVSDEQCVDQSIVECFVKTRQ